MSTVHIRLQVRGPKVFSRSLLLERVLLRAATVARSDDWRAAAFRVIAPGGNAAPPPAPVLLAAARRAGGAAARVGGGAAADDMATGAAGAAWVCLATPVQFTAGMSRVVLPAGGLVRLDSSEAEALAADFNRIFVGSGARLVVAGGGLLLCLFERVLAVATHDPETVQGHDVFDFQAAGTDAPRLRLLMSEMEMWLFDHPLNRARATAAQPAVAALWLWGGGDVTSMLPRVQGWTAGRDPLFAAFGAEPHFPAAAGAGVVVCDDLPGSTSWSDVERLWLAPAAAALAGKRIGRLEISAGAVCLGVGVGNRRFWRRPRPWWESFELQEAHGHE